MIRIVRDLNEPNLPVYKTRSRTGLDGTTKVTKYEQEKEKAIAFFCDPNHFANDKKITKKKNTNFSVYKDDGLFQLLTDVFGTKCAYCESDFGAVTPSDIEHFRPKSAIRVSSILEVKPGYYWLAGDWQNLLVSCPDCNRSRTHQVPGQTEGVVLGKGTQFPLADENVRVRHHDHDVNLEDPARLLLDPCMDDPEDHLTFDADGNVRARDIAGEPSEMGSVSIDVYALRRKKLVEARKAALLELNLVFADLVDAVWLHNRMIEDGDTADKVSNTEERIMRSMIRLRHMLDANAEYIAAKRDWIRAGNAAGKFDSLRAFGIDPMQLAA